MIFFPQKTENLKPPLTLARHLNFVMFMHSYVKKRFNLNVEGFKFNFKPYIKWLKKNGVALDGVSFEGNLSNDDFITSFLELVKRTQN